jgi:histidinol-phosphate/aromatic aminotransferase/cobyric acid decarboxylase-like protein
MKIDLDAMAEASKGAGLVFVNNPNNPTATAWAPPAPLEWP